MMHEDPEVARWLNHLDQDYVSIGSIMDEHRRPIRIHSVFGGHSEYFFLMEWEDTHVFFSIAAPEGIMLINKGITK